MTSAFTAAQLRARLKGPALIYLVAGVLTRVGFILLIPLYTRKLDPAEYGDYVLAQTALSVAPAFVLGLPAALSLFYFESPDRDLSRGRVGAVAKLIILVTLAVGLLLQGLIVAFLPASATGLFGRWSLTCVLVAATGSVVASVPVQFLRDAQKPLGAAAFQLTEFFLIVGTGVLFVSRLGRGLAGSLEALALTYLVLGSASVIFVYAYLGGSLSGALAKKALRFSLPYVVHFLALWVQGVADRWAMKLAGLGSSLGPYSLASQVSTPGLLVVTAWNMERSARTGEVFREGGLSALRRDMRALVQSYMIASAVPSLAVLAAIPLLRLFISPSFYSAFMYLPVLLLFNFVDALYLPCFLVVYYASKSKWISTVTGVSAVTSIALNVAFVPIFGVWGALLARGAASLIRTASLGFAATRCFAPAKRDGSAGVRSATSR